MPKRVAAALVCVCAALALVSSCVARSNDPKTVIFWTSAADPIRTAALTKIARGFEKATPGYHVQIALKPSLGVGDATSLITAVRGHTGPDVYLADRFTAAQYAATGLLTDMQPYVDKDPGLRKQYVDFAWTEGSYQGHMYSMPMDTATNATLYYNKGLLRAAGIDPAVLDPHNGPPTIAQVTDIAKRLTVKGKNGSYTRMGFIPWTGQGFWAAWALARGATFYDQKTCTIDATQPALLDTFTQFQSWARTFGYSATDAFTATYQPPGSPVQQSLFYSGKVGMQIDGNWAVENLKDYAPKVHYGVTYLPVPHKGDPPASWSGGFGMSIPTGAANPDGAWKFIRYASGAIGQRVMFEDTGELPSNRSVLADRKLMSSQQFFVDLLEKHTSSRPPLPVMAQYSNALDQAQEAVLLGDSTPKQALTDVAKQVQGNMDQYCPFALPKPAS